MLKSKTVIFILGIGVILGGLMSLSVIKLSFAEVSYSRVGESTAKAVTWLKNSQNKDGSWGEKKISIIDTAAVLEALYYSGEKDSQEYQKALDWFNLTYPENSGYLAEKTIALAQAGQDISSLSEFLAGQLNEQDFGFGYQRNYQSEIAITAKALKAITSSNYTDPGSDPNYTLKSTIKFLLLSQNLDGGWGFMYWDKKSSALPTLIVLDALWPYYYKMDAESKEAVDAALSWAKNKQASNGVFENLAYTGLAYKVLKLYNIDFDYYEQGIEYLLNSQNPDGSFGDIYTTVAVILGLKN